MLSHLKNKKGNAYERKKDRERARNAAKSRLGRDIALNFPKVKDPERRTKGLASYEFFCRTYFSRIFYLESSDDQKKMDGKIEQAVIDGGQFAYAMPRGSGKSSRAEIACLWATLKGARQFPLFIGSEEGSALESLDSLKRELETNDLLFEDFPEVCYPIRMLEGIAHRCKGQIFNGQRTHILWTNKTIVLPTIPGSAASAAIIKAVGITGRIRGMKFKRPDGRMVRPDIAVLDDPQTDESARSPSQCEQRKKIVNGAVLGLAGPGKKIAAIMPCTVIAPGDLADDILDRQKNPSWQGERTKLLYGTPKHPELWEQYAEIRADSLRAGNQGREATEFYRQNQAAMDEGLTAAWPARYDPDEIGAIQFAMNLKLRDPATFEAEYQNDPPEERIGVQTLTAAHVLTKCNGLARGVVPAESTHLTAHIDVQGSVLYYLVAAWTMEMEGAIIDYGTYPDQRRDYFTLADVRHTLMAAAKLSDENAAIHAGLKVLVDELSRREWRQEGGNGTLRLQKILVDAGYKPDIVHRFCRASDYANIVMPSLGRYIGASSVPFEQYTKKPGEVIGEHWLIPTTKGKRVIRHVHVDTNFWKTFVSDRMAMPMGAKGGITVYGKDGAIHKMLSEHLTSEYCVPTEGRGRTVNEWKLKAGRPDNHGLDNLVGAAVAASMLGCRIFPSASRKKPAAKPAAKPKDDGFTYYEW